MDESDGIICRFCFKLSKLGFEVTALTKMMMDALLNGEDWYLSQDALICQSCEDILKMSCGFKSMCIDKATDTTLSIREEPEECVSTSSICTFCRKQMDFNNYVYINVLFGAEIIERISTFIPELNFDPEKDSVTCVDCGKKCETYVKFASNFLEIEKDINKYISSKVWNSNINHITLSEIYNYLFKNEVEPKEIKQDPEEKTDIFMQSSPKEESNIGQDMFNLDDTGCISSLDLSAVPKEIYKCSLCPYETFRKSNLNSHILTHSKKGDTTLYKCMTCPFETKWKRSFKRHLVSHEEFFKAKVFEGSVFETQSCDGSVFKEKYKCSLCSYETYRESNLKSHSVTHKKMGDTTIFKCDSCPFETKWKLSFKRHVLNHQDVPKAKIYEESVFNERYKCSFCSYETYRESNLKSHTLTHKKIGDTTLFKCEHCPFETKWKISFKRHVMSHQDVSKAKSLDGSIFTEIYKCSICPYETYRKSNFKSHNLTHKDVKSTTLFKCKKCPFETKWKRSFKRHVMSHEENSELKVIDCQDLAYKIEHLEEPGVHWLTYKDMSGTEMYKCSCCTYETKWKTNLKKHQLTHEDESDVNPFKCEYCTYETDCYNNLKMHGIIHEQSGEIVTFKCDCCPYETKRKSCLRRHLIVHRNLRCKECDYVAKDVESLRNHQESHGDKKNEVILETGEKSTITDDTTNVTQVSCN